MFIDVFSFPMHIFKRASSLCIETGTEEAVHSIDQSPVDLRQNPMVLLSLTTDFRRTGINLAEQ
jgi:hypothetical protein